ncbi:MAG: cytochrome c biogenesis protein CcdA [Actinobacteria bacterium]|nr:cytochrome c biogenesis protein CcdA [Actinomycetota bacterium]
MVMVGLAFLAGVLSFTSPCCLPLMPGYVSYISGVSGHATSGATTTVPATRSRALWTSLLFVLGFGTVFTALGAGASAIGEALLANRRLLSQVGGVVIIAMGLVLAGAIRAPILLRERRLDLARIRPGPAGAMPMGMAFAIGWVPCIGPVLASILTLAAADASIGQAALLLAVYSAGLGVPFVGLAVAADRFAPITRWLRRHARAVELSGATVLIVMGALLLSNQWLRFFAPLTRLFTNAGWPPI